jgi:hypothetical protein
MNTKWTSDKDGVLYPIGRFVGQHAKEIVDAHNDALDAEREKVQTLMDALNRLTNATQNQIQIDESIALDPTEEDWIELRQAVSQASATLAQTSQENFTE